MRRASGGGGQYRMTPERMGLGFSSLVHVQFMFVLFIQFTHFGVGREKLC